MWPSCLNNVLANPEKKRSEWRLSSLVKPLCLTVMTEILLFQSFLFSNKTAA